MSDASKARHPLESQPTVDLDLRRDSAPAARRPCKDVVTTYLPTVAEPLPGGHDALGRAHRTGVDAAV